MTTPDRIRDLAEHAVRADEPALALRTLTVLREELLAFERLQVARALDAGQSFGDVARALGISRQAAHRRYRDLVGMSLPDPRETRHGPSGKMLVSSEARTAVNLARQEAGALGSGVVGSEHLLLGIVRCPRARASHLLRQHGVSLEAARRAVLPTLVDGAPPPPAKPLPPVAAGPRGISDYARAVFEESLREAVRRGDGYIGVEHLLLACLADGDGGACRTLVSLGVEPAVVRAEVAAA
jgi:hypothetical protein